MAFAAAAPLAIGARATATVDRLVAQLEAADPGRRGYFDYHGNAWKEGQQLMQLRFDATADITRHIDRLDADTRHAELRAALFDVLGFVKDPAAIDWLREKPRTDAANFYGRFIWRWQGQIHGDWEWLAGRERWIAFWIDTFKAEPSAEHRIAILRLIGQFDDANVIAFFKALRAEATVAKEMLLAESWLDEHDIPVQSERIAWAIGALMRAPEDLEFLVEMAHRLRHEAFVPFLVLVAGEIRPRSFPPRYIADNALRQITYEVDLSGKDAWLSWYAAHGMEGRAEWTRRAVDAFKAELVADAQKAAKHFEQIKYYWNEIDRLAFIETELAPHAEFHNAIAGWINLTYSSHYRERLRPLAERMGADRKLDGRVRELLQELGYVPGKRKLTWAEVVSRGNLAI